MTFTDCLLECAKHKELVEQFDRLSGTHLSQLDRRSPLDTLIDESTGRDTDAAAKFSAFVFAYVWLPLVGRED